MSWLLDGCLGEPDGSEEEDETPLAHLYNLVPTELRLLLKSKVHVPACVFPDHVAPPEGYWVGTLVKTGWGGKADIGISIKGEPVFTWARSEVSGWLVSNPPTRKRKAK